MNIGHGAITVYAYLLYCEDRRTHQCHPSYRTISAAVHLTVSTVMKHITKLADRQFITIENTSYIDKHGMKQNGNNLYTILPIQATMDQPSCQSRRRWIIATSSRCSAWRNGSGGSRRRRSWHRAQRAPRVPHCEALCALLRGVAESQPHQSFQREFGPFLRALRRTKAKAG